MCAFISRLTLFESFNGSYVNIHQNDFDFFRKKVAFAFAIYVSTCQNKIQKLSFKFLRLSLNTINSSFM